MKIWGEFLKRRNIFLYLISSVALCILVNILIIMEIKYDRAAAFGIELKEIVVMIVSLGIILPMWSWISGAKQRLFIKEFKICLLINFITNVIIVYLAIRIDRSVEAVLILSVIYSTIFVISSYITKFIIKVGNKKKNRLQ